MSTLKKHNTAILGAAFLMATSAVGPGFLTQTATFTESLMASFGFVILISIIMDIGVQLNVWRVVAVSKKRAQEIANLVFPGVGYLLAFLIIAGGLAFNIGNIGGANKMACAPSPCRQILSASTGTTSPQTLVTVPWVIICNT